MRVEGVGLLACMAQVPTPQSGQLWEGSRSCRVWTVMGYLLVCDSVKAIGPVIVTLSKRNLRQAYHSILLGCTCPSLGCVVFDLRLTGEWTLPACLGHGRLCM